VYFAEKGKENVPPNGSIVFPLESLEVIDPKENKNADLFVFNKDNNGEKIFVCSKPSRRQVSEFKNCVEEEAQVICEAFRYKPVVKRSGQREGSHSGFICEGWRKNNNDSYIGQYQYKKNCPIQIKRMIQTGLNKFVYTTEELAKRIHQSLPDSWCFRRLQRLFELPTMTDKEGLHTQFCVFYNYCSPVHVDEDYYYCTLKVVSAKQEFDTILQYFCFPQMGVTIPLRNGDVLVFDPRQPHCASTPRFPTSYIASCYVSKKTIQAHVSTSI
jgi:hypothetical protein